MALDEATGRDAVQMHLAYTRPASWTQQGFARDPARGVAYATWQEGDGGACHVDQADARSGARRTIATYDCSTAGTKLLGFDPTHTALVTAGSSTVSTVDARTGAVLSTSVAIPAFSTNHSWDQCVVLTNGGRVSVAVPNRVAHQDDVTGATTAAAIVFATV